VGQVTANFATARYQGAVSKSIRVTTDEPGGRPVVLELKATIVPLIEVRPSERPVVRMTYGEPTATELTVATPDGRPFAILGIDADPRLTVGVARAPEPAPSSAAGTPATKPTAGPLPSSASGSNRYVVTIIPKADVAVGRTGATVMLSTDLPKAEKVPIQVMLTVFGAVQVTPPRIVVQPAPKVSAMRVRVSKPTGDPLVISKVETLDADFTATVTTVSEGRAYDVELRYGGAAGRGRVSSNLVVHTNAPGQSVIVVPVSGQL
jgi:hypothetical protein